MKKYYIIKSKYIVFMFTINKGEFIIEEFDKKMTILELGDARFSKFYNINLSFKMIFPTFFYTSSGIYQLVLKQF